MNKCRLPSQWMILGNKLMGNIPRHTKVRILINCTGNKTCHIDALLTSAQYPRKRRWKGWCSLNGRKRNFSNIGTPIKPKDPIDSIGRHRLPNTHNRGVHGPNILQVRKDKCLFRNESTGNDILGIFHGQMGKVIQIIPRFFIVHTLEEELFIIGHLNHQRALKCLLKPLGKHKGYQMSQMHSSTGRSSPRIQIKRLVLFQTFTNFHHVSM
mmetsp:Transcript_17514/g.33208  ORF Transcript_17514/g.33208 Transcript_17514/m.33208 type:complete len:211 (+) Transcript_17514:1649-2281(+)